MPPSEPIAERRSAAPHLALLAVQVMFGTWPIAGKIILRSLSPVGLVAFRVLGAAIAMAGLGWVLRSKRVESLRDYGMLAIFSLLGVVLNQLLFVKGLELTTVINATLLGSTIPVFALMIGVVMGRERLTVLKVLAIALAAAGVIYLVDPLKADLSRNSLNGDVLLLLNSFCYGAYLALSQDMVRRYGALTVITWVFILGNAVTLPLAIWQVAPATIVALDGTAWLCLAYVVIFPTIGAYFLNGWALSRVDPSLVAIYIYIQPLFAFALAPLVLNERWNPRAWLAMALIFAGVFVATKSGRRRAGKVVRPAMGEDEKGPADY